jgi:hypothetical protein
MDYCSKPSEVAKTPKALGVMQFIANGNNHAFDFIWRCWNFCHIIDDLVDKDESVTINEIAREIFLFIQMISLNPFFQLHKHSLLPLILNACDGWVAGERAASQGKRYSAVLKCSDFVIYSHVAFLVGGWEHMRNLDEIRSYDKE